MKNLLNSSLCLYRNKMVGIVEFKFDNLSLIKSVQIEGDVDLNLELFVTNNNKTGYKIITHRDTISGESPEHVFDPPVYANNIILKSKDKKDALKIKNLKVEGEDCIESRLITKNKEEIVNLLKTVSTVTHITKDNLDDFNLNNFVYFADECVDDSTLNTLDRILVVKQLCATTNKHLIMNNNWLNEHFDKVSEFTCDPDILDIVDIEHIIEPNANLKEKASHKLRYYDLNSHKILADALNPKILRVLFKRHLKLKKELLDEVETYDFTKYKDTYTVCYNGTTTRNIVNKNIVHHPYETVSRLLNNLIDDLYIDRKEINIHVSTDEQPFLDYIKSKFEIVSSIDLHRYDINTDGLKISIDDTESYRELVEARKKQYKKLNHKDVLVDLIVSHKSSKIILSHGMWSDYIKILGDKSESDYIEMNTVFAKF